MSDDLQTPMPRPQTDDQAIGSLVCGILGFTCFPVLPSLIAVILGHVSRNNIRRSQGLLKGDGLAVGGLITGYLGLGLGLLLVPLLMAGMLLPVLSASREKARRVNCAGNLKSIGLGLLMYSGENNGDFPPTLGVLDKEALMRVGRVYVCPSTSMAVPQSADEIDAGVTGYLYFGSGLKDDDPNATITVIACDKPDNHSGKWINALFIDGHAEGVQAQSIEEAAQRHGWIIPGKSPPSH